MSEYIIVKRRQRRDHERAIDLPTLDELYRRKMEELTELEKVRKEFADKEKSKHAPKGHTFTFVEGLLLAFLFQYTLGPIISAALKAQGLQ
jgi:hypothetical protein